MRFHNTLDTKFKQTENLQTDLKTPPVSVSLPAFLQNQLHRIDHLIGKKKKCEQRLEEIERKDLSSRENLKNRMEEEQIKHQKKRKQFLQKRVKSEKFKITEVFRKRGQYLSKVKQKKKNDQAEFKRHKSATIQFWNTKSLLIKKSFDSQTAVEPLYEDSVSRKKVIEKKNQIYGQQIKDQLFLKHSKVQQRIQTLVKQKQKVLQEYNQKLQIGYGKNLEILETKQAQFINKICFQQDRSKLLVRKNTKDWEKKLDNKNKLQNHMIKTTRENFLQRTQKRAQSMKNCRCHDRGLNPQVGLTTSKMLSEQDISSRRIKVDGKIKSSWSVVQSRKNFMVQSQANLSSVINNKSIIRQKRDLQDEKKLMTQKEISNAIKRREQIKNQSNFLVRQARILA